MPKYIDPDLLTRELERRKLSTGRLIQWQYAMESAVVEVPEIVRCKECAQCYYADNRAPDERCWACGKHGIDVSPDWFCADGERKKGCGEDACDLWLSARR